MNSIGADNYFAIIPEWVLYSDITATAVRLYATLQRYADKETGACHPSRATLAQKCACNIKSIDRALLELIQIGAVVKKHRISANGDMTSNQYTVITNAGVATKLHLPSDKNTTTGGDKNGTQTKANLNQSQEPTVAQSIADEWWKAYKIRTGGKSPTGKGAWHSLLAVINGALQAGWAQDQVRAAVLACTVPSAAQVDRELNKAQTGLQQPMKPKQRATLPTISGDAECTDCGGSGLINAFNDADQKWQAKKCGCYRETFIS